ncbi:MAG: DUF4097 family beta strand repeat-containing protein, partial [Candidatus Acidiferrales bacterium]
VLAVFVLVGVGIYSKVREKSPDINIDLGFFNHQSSHSLELPARVIAPGSHVTVTTPHGSITAHAGNGNDLRVSVNETAEAATDAAAQSRLKFLNVVIEQTSLGYSVHPANLEHSDAHLTIDLDVTVPKKVSLTANSNHGDINISGLSGSVTASTQNGGIEVHNAGSDVTAQLETGDARIDTIAGNVHVTGRGNEIEVNDVTGDAAIEGEFFGPIRVRNVAKTTHYASQKADLTLIHLAGRLELDSGEINISDVSGAAKMSTHDKDMDVENVSGRLDVSDTHGSIKVTYSQPPREQISITNVSGDIDLSLPAESKFEISAVSTSGEVQSDFEDSSLQLSNENDTGRLTGKVGTTGPKIQLTTTYGTIYLRKSS